MSTPFGLIPSRKGELAEEGTFSTSDGCWKKKYGADCELSVYECYGPNRGKSGKTRHSRSSPIGRIFYKLLRLLSDRHLI